MMIFPVETLERLSAEKGEENRRFIAQIKKVPGEQFDRVITDLGRHYTSRIDCTQCANCCRSVHVGVTRNETEKLACVSGAGHAEFVSGHVDMEPDGTGGYLKERPCIFLQNTTCTIYDQRPASCRQYPGLSGTQLKYRIRRIMEEYTVCPIVYHTIEGAKQQLLPADIND